MLGRHLRFLGDQPKVVLHNTAEMKSGEVEKTVTAKGEDLRF